MPTETFATVLNCIDGRVQLPVIETVRRTFGVSYVDAITAPGIVKFVSDEVEAPETRVILSSIEVSLGRHHSRAIAVAAHHDCAGNPQDATTQRGQLHRAIAFLEERFPVSRVIGLWVDSDWVAERLAPRQP